MCFFLFKENLFITTEKNFFFFEEENYTYFLGDNPNEKITLVIEH